MVSVRLELDLDEGTGLYTVTSPDVSGLVTEGATPEEIQHNVGAALENLLELPSVFPAESTTNPGQNGSGHHYDRFRLGWRIRPRLTPEGKIKHVRIPLTAYDILHPQEGDFRVHNDEHRLVCRYLDNVISAQVSHIPGTIVLHDTRVAWDVDGLDPHGPDIALIFNVREHKKWGTFDVRVEATRPTLIVEVTSPETRQLDLVDKVEEYAQAGVQCYIIVDAHKSSRQPNYRLIGYQLTPDGYINLQPNAQGRLWLAPAQIWLGLLDDQLHCYDVDGHRIGDYVEIAKAYQETEARLRALEEEIRRLRGAAN